MIIKKQIDKLLLKYKEDFRKETGLNLIVFPDTAIEQIELSKLKETTEELLGIKINSGRFAKEITAKKMFARISIEMGYSNKEIGEVMNLDRNSIHYYRHKGGMYGDQEYERSFAKYKEQILKTIK